MESCAGTISAGRDVVTACPVRVLAIIPAASSKASMVFARRQVASLQRAGVLCQTFPFIWTLWPWTLIQEWRRLRGEIRLFRPHLLHAHYGTATAFFAGVSSTLPLVVTYRGSDLNPCSSMSRVRGWAGRLLSQLTALRATQIVCVSEQLRARLWWRKHRVTVIPTGVDTEIFYPRSRREARAQLGWGDGERVVLFNAGKEPKIKRLDLAQAAVQVARNLCGHLRFAVVNGDVPPQVMPVMMAAADCLLLTSDWEGSPTVIQEAMACDLPVVSVDAGDVQVRLAGIWPSRIVSRKTEEIGKALADILLQGKRSNGSSRVRELSNAVIVERLISLYHAAIQKRPAVHNDHT